MEGEVIRLCFELLHGSRFQPWSQQTNGQYIK